MNYDINGLEISHLLEFLQKPRCGKNSRFIEAESMIYSQYQQLKPEDFKRLCGVHYQTFVRMVAVLEEQVEPKKLQQGLPSKLSIADQVFVSLEKGAGVPHILPQGANLGSA